MHFFGGGGGLLGGLGEDVKALIDVCFNVCFAGRCVVGVAWRTMGLGVFWG